MAKQYLIEVPWWDGKQLHTGPIIEVPDDLIPSVTWRDPVTKKLVRPEKPEELVLTPDEREFILDLRREKDAPKKPTPAPAPAPVAKPSQTTKVRPSDKETI